MDSMIVVSTTNIRQNNAIAQNIKDRLKENGFDGTIRIEGNADSKWLLIDLKKLLYSCLSRMKGRCISWIVCIEMFQSLNMIYDTLAQYYDALVKDEEASRMWVDWIESKCSPCDVLELACGSGEITEMLVQDGFDVSALDLSDEMIEQAKQKDVDNKIHFIVRI